jgi:hypothetical protein
LIDVQFSWSRGPLHHLADCIRFLIEFVDPFLDNSFRLQRVGQLRPSIVSLDFAKTLQRC